MFNCKILNKEIYKAVEYGVKSNIIPSVQFLAEETGLSKQQIKKGLDIVYSDLQEKISISDRQSAFFEKLLVEYNWTCEAFDMLSNFSTAKTSNDKH